MANTKQKMDNGKTVDEVLATLTDEQKKAVSIFLAIAVEKEIESLKFDADED